jgi:hypothetical protein
MQAVCPRMKKEWTEKKISPNFERLVLGCMESYDSESRLIFQHFSKSIRFTPF